MSQTQTRRNVPCAMVNCVKRIYKFLPAECPANVIEEEIWNVKALPFDVKSTPKSSQVIDKLLEKRRIQHETVINQIGTEFEEINLDIEAQIRLHSELLKREFQNNENEVQKSLQKISAEHEAILSLTKTDFSGVADVISEKHVNCVNAIDVFHQFLEDLEKSRSNKFKQVLRRAYEDLHKISYILPHEIQQYFEHELLKINQMLLSNFRCYSDLQQNLHLQAENNKRVHMQKVDALKSKWKHVKKKDVLFKLNEQKLVKANCEAIMLQTEQGQIVSKMFNDKEQNMNEMWTHLSPLPISRHDVNLWSISMQDTVNSLDFFARKLITMYKMAVVQVFDGYFDELQNLTEGMLEMGLTDNEESSAMSLEICKPAIETATRKYSDELVNLQALWDSVIMQLQGKLQSTYLFLHTAAHLWDSHFERTEEAKQIVLKDLKNVIRKNDKMNQDQEIKLNIALDELRQASTEADLEYAHNNVTGLLDTLLKIYNSHYAAEVKVIGKYETLIADEAEVLLAELRQFLHDNPKSTDGPTQMKTRASQCTLLENSESSFLPYHMKQCEYQVDAVHNWMFGLREAIESYVVTCKEDITQQAIQWTTEHTKKLAKRLDVKVAIHKPRYARVKFDIYDIRLTEIKHHNERLARHKAGAEKEIEDIKQFYKVQETKYQEILKSYYKKVNDLSLKMETAKNSNTLKAYIADLNYSTNLCNKKITELIEKEQDIFKEKLASITAAAVKFSKQMKLFLEEGNFNFDEAKKATKDLKTFEKSIKKKFNIVTKDIATKEKKMFIQIHQEEKQLLSGLRYCLEEFEYNDKTITAIKNIQTHIKSEVYKMKVFNNNTEESFQAMKSNTLTNIGDINNLDDFEKSFIQFVSDLLDFSNYLYQPEPTTNVNIERFKNVSSMSQKRKNSKVRRSTAMNSADNYLALLFESEPNQDDSCMSKICSDLYKSFQTLQTEAKLFYESHSDIVNKNQVQPSFKQFMREVLQKYMFYHLQCELVWLDVTNQFIEIVQQAYQLFVEYQHIFFEKHYELHLNSFKGKQTEVAEVLSAIKQTNMETLYRIYGKLKPLHGYKKNKHLLEALQQEARDALQNIRETDINDLLQPFQENQESHFSLYKSEFVQASSKLGTLHNLLKPLLDHPLIHQFQEKLLHMVTFTNEMSSECDEDADEITTLCACITISPKYGKSLRNMTMLSIQEYEKNDGITYEDNEELQDLLQKFNEEYNHCVSYVNNTASTWYTVYDEFERILKADIRKILKLYSVKYDNPSQH